MPGPLRTRGDRAPSSRTRPALVWVALSALAADAAACAGPTSGPTPRPGLILCHEPLTVAVDVSRGPRFTWSPGCGATYMEVTSPDRQQVYWVVQGDTGKIAPGVVYGAAPPAYESRLGPFPLDE